MSDPFIGEIKAFGFNFAPYGWSTCEGQIMQIVQNTALFSIIGNYYGGDGRTTFALPNLQGRAPMHFGQGQGLTNRTLAQTTGAETVTLTSSQMAPHSHALTARDVVGDLTSPSVTMPANCRKSSGHGYEDIFVYLNANPTVQMNASAIGPSGGGQAHENRQPYTVVNMCIALQGIYPVRS